MTKTDSTISLLLGAALITCSIALLVCVGLSACDMPSVEEQIYNCHSNGYTAETHGSAFVDCCSVLNGDRVCIRANYVTKHRKELWPQ